MNVVKWAALSIIALVVITIGYVSYKPLANGRSNAASAASNLVEFTTETREAPSGMKEYRSVRYRFSLLLPEGMTVTETEGREGSSTLTIEGSATQRGFQIFIVQFLEEQVTEERFRMDNPSGVRNDMQDITIDGVAGASFYSKDQRLGETAEVWFVKNGYLYEVTTLAPLAPWLSDIMATWEFIESF